MSKRKVYKIEIYRNLHLGTETRYIEAKDWTEAKEMLDMLRGAMALLLDPGTNDGGALR